MLFKKIYFLIPFLLISCASNVNLPANRFITSETNGTGGKLGLALKGASQVTLENDLSTSPIPADAGVLNETMILSPDLYLSMTEIFDLGIEYNMGGQTILRAIVQLYGDSTRNAKQWSPSLAINLGAGVQIQNASLTADNGSTRTFWLGSTYVDYEATIGLRILDPLLLYVGIFNSHYSIDIDMGTVQVDTQGNLSGFHVGTAYYWPSFSAKIDVSKNTNTYSGHTDNFLDKKDSTSFGFIGEYLF